MKPTVTFVVTLKFLKRVLGGKASDPFIFLSHQVERARDAIEKWSKSNGKNKKSLRFLNAKTISEKNVIRELQGLRNSCEQMFGEEIEDEIWDDACENNLSKKTRLYTLLESVKGVTIFSKDEKGLPYYEDYVTKGCLKDLAQLYCERVPHVRGEVFSNMSYTASAMNRHVFTESIGGQEDRNYFYTDKLCKKKSPLMLHPDKSINYLERSLRASTAQGPRISLARSEQVTAGTYMKFTITSFLPSTSLNLKKLKDLLSIGKQFGMSNWRNAGNGSFTVVSIEEK